jgi:hypothetical protein
MKKSGTRTTFRRSNYHLAITCTPRRDHRLYQHRQLRLERLEERSLLATITVTTPHDVVDLTDDVISLREAIFAANIVTGHDALNFDFGHDGPATIVLRQGELKITDALTIQGTGPQLLTIDAGGSDPTPDQHNHDGSRIFNIDGSGQLNISIAGLTLTGGDVLGVGGAILNFEDLLLSNCVVAGNSAHGGFDGGGGGVYSAGGLLRNHGQQNP